jgi:hypothetical protein
LLTSEGVRFASISKKTSLSKLSFAFVSLALPLLEAILEYGTFLYVVVLIHSFYSIVSVTSDPYLKVHSVHGGE